MHVGIKSVKPLASHTSCSDSVKPLASLSLLDRVRLHKPRERATCVKSQMITKNWGTEPEKLKKKPHKSAL